MSSEKVVSECASNKKCKKCHSVPVSGLTCVVCGGSMHPGCIKYYPDIVRLDLNTIKCCSGLPGAKATGNHGAHIDNNILVDDELNCSSDSAETVIDLEQSEGSNKIMIDDLVSENDRLRIENALLRKLVSEMDDKNQLLIFKINTLENADHTTNRSLLSNAQAAPSSRSMSPVGINLNMKNSATHSCSTAERDDNSKNTKNTLVPSRKGQRPAKPNNNKNKNHLVIGDSNLNFSGVDATSGQARVADRSTSNKRNRVVIGLNKEATIRAAPKLGHLHVYRLSSDTSEEMLSAFLRRSAPNINFSCQKLTRRDETSASFKVSFPIADVDKVYNGSIWPDGSAVKRFFFPKPKNFSSLDLPKPRPRKDSLRR